MLDFEGNPQAEAEGWCISHADGSSQNHDGRSPWQLQRIDENAHFDGDGEAWKHVLDKARDGSQLHNDALDFLVRHSAGEIDEIAKTYPDIRNIIGISSDVRFIAKWVERGLYDEHTRPIDALKVIANWPNMPWKKGRWNVDHLPYAEAFYKDFPDAKGTPQHEKPVDE